MKKEKNNAAEQKRSLIYTVMMCFLMVLWMSMYNVAIHNGSLGLDTVREGWLGFPIAYIYAMIFDWFIVSTPAKKFAFRFLVGPESSTIKKVFYGILLYGHFQW